MKERLTGAIILVALIVLLVPELLTGPIRMKSAPAASATGAAAPAARPARAEPPLRSYTLTLSGVPVPPQPAATPAAAAPTQPAANSRQIQAQEAPAADSAQTPPETSGSNAEAAPPPPQSAAADASLQAAKSPTHPVVREARAPASSSGWVVQLGSFASRQNANRLAHTLAGRGFRMSVSPARAGSRVLWRVRAGPARDRAGAEHLAARLRALGHRGELLPVR